MISEVVKGIYRLEIPLPIPVVGSMNCYVLKDPERSLVVDPGMAHEMCRSALMTGLDYIGVDLKRCDFFVTHHHLDHFGLLSQVMSGGSTVYVSAMEAGIVEKIGSGEILPILSRLLRQMGFPEEDPMKALPELLGEEYGATDRWPFHHLSDHAVLHKGGRSFRCHLTPGHSPGHLCLYESHSRLLISGDAFSPVLQFFSDEENPLSFQLRSIREINLLKPEVVLPGHGGVVTQINKTTDRLEAHHRSRTEGILQVLTEKSMDAYQVAGRLERETSAASGPWNELPVILKFIATRDCLAHLLYLESEGRVRKKTLAGRTVYLPAENGQKDE